jgi:hypothetical protein
MAYSTGDTLVRAVMTASTGLVADQIVNDFAFQWTGGGEPAEANYNDLFTAVDAFYNYTTTTTRKTGYYISNYVNRSATHELQAYEIAVGGLGSPVFTDDWLGPATAAGNGMPPECAGVLSFHADLTGILEESGATRPKARRRGRVYVGPLDGAAIDPSTPPYLLISAFQTTIKESANQMASLADADGWTWAVWSRKDVQLRAVVGGWTDNAPDTQRRRGPKSTARSTFTI